MHKLTLLIAISLLCLCSVIVQGQVIHYEQNFDDLKEGEADGRARAGSAAAGDLAAGLHEESSGVGPVLIWRYPGAVHGDQ